MIGALFKVVTEELKNGYIGKARLAHTYSPFDTGYLRGDIQPHLDLAQFVVAPDEQPLALFIRFKGKRLEWASEEAPLGKAVIFVL